MSRAKGTSTQFIDVNICNNSSPLLLASYSANLSNRIVQDGNNYDISVVRLKVPASAIPLSTRFADNEFSVSLSIGVDSTVANCFQTKFLLNSLILNGSQFLTSYNDWITCINGALDIAFQDLLTDNPTLTSTLSPYIALDGATQLMTIYVPTTYATDSIYLWFNNNTAYKFIWPNINCTPTNPLDRAWVPAGITNPISDFLVVLDNSTLGGAGNNYYLTQQESSSLANFNNLESIVLATNTMPIGQEVSLSNIDANQSYNQNLFTILTDFEVNVGTVIDRGYIYYASSGYQRRYAITSSQDISKIDIQFLFKTTTGKYYPLYIPLFTNASVKLELRRIEGNRYITTN